MENKILFIEQNKKMLNSKAKIIDKIFFRYEIDINEKYVKLNINKQVINVKLYKKINKIVKKYNLGKIIVDRNIELEKGIETLQYQSKKIIFKMLLIDVLQEIMNQNGDIFENQSLYLIMEKEQNKSLIFELASKFKYIEIVSKNIARLRRFYNRMEKNEDVLLTISNNKNKALKRAKYIINFDCDSEYLKDFSINRKAIIINLSNNELNLKNSFNGTIIENINIDFEEINDFNIDFEKYDKNIIGEIYVTEFKNNELLKKMKIVSLNGKNGIIDMPKDT